MPLKKFVIFVEGQGELIFIRRILFHLIDPGKFSFTCLRLRADIEQPVPYLYGSPNAEVHFQIIDVGNDEKVLAVIKMREEGLTKAGFTKIIGLRDMYSEAYRGASEGTIDDNLTQKFIEGVANTIAQLNNPDKIRFHFSIMEIEAWWLSMYNLFSKIDATLTFDFIEKQLGYNLSKIDPQKIFFHPTSEVNKILGLVGINYGKRFDEVERIVSRIDSLDINNALENSRCASFNKFCEDLCS